MDTRPDSAILWFACAYIGAVFMPMNTALRGTFLEHQLRVSGTFVLFVDRDHADAVTRIDDGVRQGISAVVLVGAEPSDILEGLDVVSMESVGEKGREHPVSVADSGRWNEHAMILFTSGTTGPSKGVILSHHFVVNMADLYMRCLQIGPDDVFYSGLPLFHLSGSVITLLAPLVSGAKGVLDKAFSVSGFWRRVREVGATHTLLLGAMTQMLWQREPDEYEKHNTMRAVVAVPITKEMFRRFEERFGVKVVTGYGISETGQIMFSSVDHQAVPGTSGRPVASYDVVIVDDNDEPLPPGEPGELLVRPRRPHLLFEGYCGDPEATTRALRNFWLHTGDICSIDADGNFRFVDRKKDYLRRRGENISSYEVEQAILQSPDVLDVAVVGVPSEMGEDEVKACIVLADGVPASEESLIRYCIALMPYFAVPRFIEFYDALPRNDVGRVQKFVLRAEHATRPGWDREAVGVKVTRHSAAELGAAP
jgi:crotonobetaine/carnitine-CoA ligase